jgi:hypothetical protein
MYKIKYMTLTGRDPLFGLFNFFCLKKVNKKKPNKLNFNKFWEGKGSILDINRKKVHFDIHIRIKIMFNRLNFHSKFKKKADLIMISEFYNYVLKKLFNNYSCDR